MIAPDCLRSRLNSSVILLSSSRELIRCNESDIRSAGILLEKDTLAGTGDSAQEELVQLFDIKRMIPEDVLRELY